jgi:hypothetical protein
VLPPSAINEYRTFICGADEQALPIAMVQKQSSAHIERFAESDRALSVFSLAQNRETTSLPLDFVFDLRQILPHAHCRGAARRIKRSDIRATEHSASNRNRDR